MKLRPHQERAIEMLRECIGRGKTRPILAAPCSFGKTIVAAQILKNVYERGNRGIFICDRIKLVQQTLEGFDNHGIPCGVMQGHHERTDVTKPIQIASIQTLMRRRLPHFDVAIVDECHTAYKSMNQIMQRWNKIPFIGLSATPYSKGLGQVYDKIVVPITPRELLNQGYLAPVHYYGGKMANLDNVKMKALPTGGRDYDPDSLGQAIEHQKGLVGNIIGNWKKYAQDSQTIAFSPSIKNSKYLVAMFREHGISAEHIDGYTDEEERQWLYKAHDDGEFKILSCSRLLNTGYDAPSVKCLIDLFPTRSLIQYVQRAGRIMRLHKDKEHAIYLDHAGNVRRHGFPEDVVPWALDLDDKKFNEKDQVKKEESEEKIFECPECYAEMKGLKCQVCGYERPKMEQIQSTDELLEKIKDKKKLNRETSKPDKERWLGELLKYASDKGFAKGWASHKYKSKFGVWPNAIRARKVSTVSEDVKKFITRENIINNRKFRQSVGRVDIRIPSL
mgnify:CR=1 FL=1